MNLGNPHDLCSTCGHTLAFHQIGRGTGVPAGVPFCDDRHDDKCHCGGFTSSSTRAPTIFERTHWQSMDSPDLVIDLRKIAVVRRVETYHFHLTAFTEAGFEIQILAPDVDSFMTAWRACP